MGEHCRVLILLGGLVASVVNPPAASGQPNTVVTSDVFLRASHGPDGISFPSTLIDWRALAPDYIRALMRKPIDADRLESLRRIASDYDTASLFYETLLDPRLKRDHYYLISPGGIAVLDLTIMKGEALFFLKRWSIDRVVYEGNVLARERRPGPYQWPGGGFVVRRPTPIPEEFLTRAEKSLQSFLDTEPPPPSEADLKMRDPKARNRTIMRAFSFSLSPNEPIHEFQWWADDLTTCTYRYAIAKPGSRTAFVATNLYGCDP